MSKPKTASSARKAQPVRVATSAVVPASKPASDSASKAIAGDGSPSLRIDELEQSNRKLEQSNRKLEEQVRQLQYVKGVSDLLTGVSHDLSGALTGIVWCTEAVRNRVVEHDPDLAAGLQDLVGAADYARRLARRLMSIGRQREGRFERCNVQTEIGEVVNLLDVLRPKKVFLKLSLEAATCEIWASADQLQQLLVNLGTNAFDAIGTEGGEVHVSLERVAPSDTDGEQVRLRVRDNGHGMSPETLRRATEPFFTTKGPDDGNGLGLVVVKSIVERHAATLRIESQPDLGTTVDVFFSTLRAEPV